MDVARHGWGWLLAGALLVSTSAAAQDPSAESAKTWAEDTEAIEAFLNDAEITELEDIGDGVTKPSKAAIVPGGPVQAFAWKDIKPGRHRGYWENYKSEIAAYELDKLLEIGMTPPTVERRVRNELGAASLWVSPAETFKSMGGPPSPPDIHIGRWNWQLICAKMFHNLIYNKDPNLGNWMVDPAWNLIIIDNSRAFTTDIAERVHKLTRIDRDLWNRMVALDEPTLQAAVGEWLGDREIRAIIERRDEMAEDIEKLVEKVGERAAFVRWRVPPPATPTPAPAPEAAPKGLKRFSNRPCTTWGGRGTFAHTDAGGPMRAYSMDLRERALLDSDVGMKAADVAAKYRVSGSWVRLLKQRRRETGGGGASRPATGTARHA